ncbi:MAG: MlaE family ABC transporter permease [Gammaproteobacteria bacterium]
MSEPASIDCSLTDRKLVISLSGDWLLGESTADTVAALTLLQQTPTPEQIEFNTTGLGNWDTKLLTTLLSVKAAADTQSISLNTSGLPEGAQRLFALALTVEEREGARRRKKKKSFLYQAGEASQEAWADTLELVTFIGKLVASFARLFRGKAGYQKSDLAVVMQEAGADALPIISLISLLIGMIFAFVGVMQLKIFGAGIYTANLVAVAMVREMAPIMTAIMMAGRTGAAYAAQLGTMKVNEEIDALKAMGINTMDYLVLPRVLALVVMMPLLTLYASLMGIIGGTVVGVIMLDVSLPQYVEQTKEAVGLNSLFGGLFKSLVYGSLVAIAGCQQGMACGNSAMAVGQSTTKAVVMGIVLIVVSASILTIVYINMGI